MKCAECSNDLRIADSYTQAVVSNSGVVEVYSVIDLKCVNPACRLSKSGEVVERVRRKIEAAKQREGDIVCCGIPIAKKGSDGRTFAMPGTLHRENEDGTKAVFICPTCKREHMAEI
ncbi:MAG: hypothetical protein RSE36_06485 [Oscillospiraceae bacterium]